MQLPEQWARADAMKLTDTHCHLDLPAFDADREPVIERARAAGVDRVLVPGLNVDSSQAAINLAAATPSLYAAVGLHPTEPEKMDQALVDALRVLATAARVVAIGEIGLDYYWVTDEAGRSQQQDSLERQLGLAAQVGLPVVLHFREAGDAEDGPCASNLMQILQRWVGGLRTTGNPLRERPGVLHSFAGTLETARGALDLGFYIGVTGPLTFKHAQMRRRVIASLPLERLLLETDSPYLAPVPHRGERNEPAFVTHIADKIAEIHSRTVPEVARVTSANAARLFAWGALD